MNLFRSLCSGLLFLVSPAGSVAGQEHTHPAPSPDSVAWSVGAQVMGLVTHAAPAMQGENLTEVYLTQPAVMAHAGFWGGRATLAATLNLEGLTLRRGELNAGIWGEGYVDRRHPHTFLHELMASARVMGSAGGASEASVSFGKGFAPFGTDDPMVRPFAKYPTNHHLAQILERLVLLGAVRHGPVLLEAGLFNGNEPTGPRDFANVRRFGDSWSARATLFPVRGTELQASYAAVESPELATGGGLNSRKRSVSARWEHGAGAERRTYALAEWARTDEYEDHTRYYSFATVLAEAALRWSGAELALRFERTERPEEERLENPFRSPRPHADFQLLGQTRWQIWTLALSKRFRSSTLLGAAPFAEVAHARVTSVTPSAFFHPVEFYGTDRMWSVSAGVRIEAGAVHQRMGRYGTAASH